MPKIPEDHALYLNKRPFLFRCWTNIFPPDEVQALTEYGNWMEALSSGVIQPVKAEHRRFLRVDREEIEPTNVMEHAWLRLKGRREFEREQEMAPPPEPPKDYGIIEWDKEKCWW